MGRSFVISLLCLGGCWDTPQLRVDVSRDPSTLKPNFHVCDSAITACAPQTAAFDDNDSTSTSRPVSIFTKKSALFLEMTSGSQMPVCITITLGSDEIACKLADSTSGLVWSCPTGTGDSPATCPQNLP